MKKRLGVIVNGATGRIGFNQHLVRALLVLRQDGIVADGGDAVFPDIFLVGRNPEKLRTVCSEFGIKNWTTDIESALSDANYPVYFDSTVTSARFANVALALQAGKHVFCEKPLAPTFEEAEQLVTLANKNKARNGVVMSHLWLPGMRKLKGLIDSGYFGQILSIKGDFGYWVHQGNEIKAQRPSWNYRKENGGGLVMDMTCHWHYILEYLFGSPKRVLCLSKTLIDRRWDENGKPYVATADDMAFAIVELDTGIPVQLSMSWCTRVRRDDLLVIQVDGTNGSAVAGVRNCYLQESTETPTITWNPDRTATSEFMDDWRPLQDNEEYENPFLAQWKCFLSHVVDGAAFPWNFASASRGVSFVEACCRSAATQTWQYSG